MVRISGEDFLLYVMFYFGIVYLHPLLSQRPLVVSSTSWTGGWGVDSMSSTDLRLLLCNAFVFLVLVGCGCLVLSL